MQKFNLPKRSSLVSLATWSFVALSLAILGLTGCGASEVPEAPPEASPPVPAPPSEPSPAEVAARLEHGIDVSSHAGTVDWEKLAMAGHTFAFVKATEGVDLKDPAFDGHWSAMKAAGIVRGAYHFYVTEDDPEEQAAFFISIVKLEPGDLVPVVDLELIGHGTKDGLAERFQTFVELLEAHYGQKPIIYTSSHFWDQHVWNEDLGEGFGGHPLWVAEYEVDAPTLPQGWTDWHLWQWQGDAEVPGVEKGADRSRVHRDGVDLSLLVVRASGHSEAAVTESRGQP